MKTTYSADLDELQEIDIEIQLNLAKTILQTIDVIERVIKDVGGRGKLDGESDDTLRRLETRLSILLDIYYGVKTKSPLL